MTATRNVPEVMRVVFLDIDGVLNGHDFYVEAQSCSIQNRCVRQLNRITKSTGCKFVLSSAWRYMILRSEEWEPAMTLKGFEYLLRTHGAVGFELIGTTCSDEDAGWSMDNNVPVRGLQISRWLADNPGVVSDYIAIDDEDYGITAAGHRLVRTRPTWGLSKRAADEAIRALNK